MIFLSTATHTQLSVFILQSLPVGLFVEERAPAGKSSLPLLEPLSTFLFLASAAREFAAQETKLANRFGGLRELHRGKGMIEQTDKQT